MYFKNPNPNTMDSFVKIFHVLYVPLLNWKNLDLIWNRKLMWFLNSNNMLF